MSPSVGAALLLLACSENGAPDSADQRLFVPEGLASSELDGAGGLTLVAFTLQQRASGRALLATVRHEGDAPACEPGMVTHFIDHAGELRASVGGTIHGGQLYRLDDAAGTLVRCLAPGQLGRVALVDLPDQVVLEELDQLQHTFPAFTLAGLSPLERALELAAAPAGAGYEGTLHNALEVAIADPKIAIFSVNRVDRPLDVATSSARLRLLPGESWTFSTTPVVERGVDSVSYATASLNTDQSAAGRE